MIHTKPEIFHNKVIDGIKVITPEEACLDDIRNIIIIYSQSYRNEAEEFCKKHGFSFIHFDDPVHLPPKRIAEIANALRLIGQSSLLRELDIKKLTNALQTCDEEDFV